MSADQAEMQGAVEKLHRELKAAMGEQEIDFEGATPVYRQVADLLRARIEAGELSPNRPIPSETQLEQEFGIARGTIRKAVQILRDEGLVVTVRGRGSFVVERASEG